MICMILIGQWIDVFLLFRFVVICITKCFYMKLLFAVLVRRVPYSGIQRQVESRFDNRIVELSPILITGINELSPTLITRIFQDTADKRWPTKETPHEGWLANLHHLTALSCMLRNMIGLWQKFKTNFAWDETCSLVLLLSAIHSVLPVGWQFQNQC